MKSQRNTLPAKMKAIRPKRPKQSQKTRQESTIAGVKLKFEAWFTITVGLAPTVWEE